MPPKSDLPTKTVTFYRPKVYKKQEDAIFNDARFSLVEASTKSGKTVGCLAWLAERALLYGGENRHFWWVAPIYNQAEIGFRRMKRFLPREIYTPNNSKLCIQLINGSCIWFKSGEKSDNLYGEDVDAAVIDEASRVREDSWNALLSTLTQTGGYARIIGNVKGRKNWFYRMCARAKGGDEPNMQHHVITAADAVAAGVIKLAVVLEAKKLLPLEVFKELYLCIPSDDGGNPFGMKAIQNATVSRLSTKPPVVWGWDFAKSHDWTVGIGLDEDGAVCRFERWRGPWLQTIARVRAITGRIPALCDSTGVGDPILEALQAASASFIERPLEDVDPRIRPYYDGDDTPLVERFRSMVERENIQGFKFSSASKQQLMEGLAIAIQTRAVCYPDGPIKDELENFEYQLTRTGVKYGAPEGMFDDCVCALALAVRAFGSRPAPVQSWG